MRSITYSWIGLSAGAPFVFLLCALVLGVFHSYRRHWRSVDLFLLAVFVQELIISLQVFIYSLLSLMKPESGIACGCFIWSINATRTLQAATITSLLVDRALTSQWPYKYRFSVRRHQIRYHLFVIATMAGLVGVASILSSEIPGMFENCSFLPFDLHIRLSLFMLSLYGLFLVIVITSIAVVQSTRGCSNSSSKEIGDISPITHGTTGSSSYRTNGGRPLNPSGSSASTTSSNASSSRHGGMKPSSSTTDLIQPIPGRSPGQVGKSQSLPNGGSSTSDFRWKTCIAVSGICILTNHLPYLVLTIMGTFTPSLLPEWPKDNLALWLSLAEGLLLPITLGLVDLPFSFAVSASCTKGNNTTPKRPHDRDPFHVFPRDEPKSFPLTNGSLFSSLLNMSVEPMNVIQPYKRGQNGGLRLGVSSEIRGLVGARSTTPPYYPSTNTTSSASTTYGGLYYSQGVSTVSTSASHEPIYSNPLSKLGSVDESIKSGDEDHIYATLSETFDSLSSTDDDSSMDPPRCCSVTTVANDDFEFHDPRLAVLNKISRNAPNIPLTSQNLVLNSDNLALNSQNAALTSENLALNSQNLALNSPTANLNYISYNGTESSDSLVSTSSSMSNSSDEIEKIHHDSIKENKHNYTKRNKERISLEELNSLHENIFDSKEEIDLDLHRANEETIDEFVEEQIDRLDLDGCGTLSKKHRCSSLSMNDLDRLDDAKSEEQMMFILPMKSESMLSLYKLYLAEEHGEEANKLQYSFEISKSEGDLAEISENQGDKNESTSGRTFRKSEGALNEVYQKKKSLESGESRIRRQHKLERVRRGVQRQKELVARGSNTQRASISSTVEGLQVSVVDQYQRKNGVITIQDPSVLSVEELFKVLNRASGASGASTQIPVVTTPQRDYKKIFVSEYI